MNRQPRREIQRVRDYEIHVVGAPRPGLRDVYHVLLRATWPEALAVIVGGYLALNLAFASAFLVTGGVANARPGSFADAFFFSVQTMGTIGYGAMYPTTQAANTVVVAESIASLIVTALATGLVFSRFSRIRARVVFSSRAAIGVLDGVPTLMVRVGNERSGQIVDAAFRMTLMLTTRTREGLTLYRAQDLTLVRDRAPALARAWMVLHEIGPGSPLLGLTPEALAAGEAEISLSLAGTDETSLQPVHARNTWLAGDIAFGARLADIISETGDGNLVLDLARFHDVVATEASGS